MMRRRVARAPNADPAAGPSASVSAELTTLTALAQAVSGTADLAESLEAALGRGGGRARPRDWLGVDSGQAKRASPGGGACIARGTPRSPRCNARRLLLS